MPMQNLIAGQWCAADDGAVFDVSNPATGAVLDTVPDAGIPETRKAIAAAAGALPHWRARTADDRGAILRRLSDLMLRDVDRLALLLTQEQGKPLPEAAGEIRYAASFIDWAAEEGKRLYGDIVPAKSADRRILVLRQPVGVTACITPWNFPTAMITRKLGPALAAGCTMVVKPAEQTPLSALALGELCQEAGVPAGVVNIITGDAEAIGDELFSNPAVRKVSFTGSTEVGKVLMTKAAFNVTRLSLELGGHAPFIVFDDADVEAAVAGAMASKFRNMGQTCVCVNRFYVQRGIYAEFSEALIAAMKDLQVGDGTVDGITQGPLIDAAAVSKVQRHIDDAIGKGARLRLGGELVDREPALFFQPTLIEDVTVDMLVSTEETFGPVAALQVFETEAEAIRMANDTPYGLAAYFYTRDASRLLRVAEALDYGIVGANDGAPSTAQAPFGGFKQSGIGREGGKYVMDEYTELKFVSWGL